MDFLLIQGLPDFFNFESLSRTIVGSGEVERMVRLKGQLKIRKDIRVELQIPPSPDENLTAFIWGKLWSYVNVADELGFAVIDFNF